MELEELKNTWAELDNRLKENKLMNKTIIMEMAQNKAEKLIDKSINQGMLNVVGMFILSPFMFYIYVRYGGKLILADVLMIYIAIVCFLNAFWCAYKVSILMKVDFSKAISNNIYYTNKYNIQFNRELIATIVFIGPSLVIPAIIVYTVSRVSIYLWAFFAFILLAGLLLAYFGVKKHNKNMASILKSMNEIKALEEEES